MDQPDLLVLSVIVRERDTKCHPRIVGAAPHLRFLFLATDGIWWCGCCLADSRNPVLTECQARGWRAVFRRLPGCPQEWNMIYDVSQYPAIETRAGHRGRFRDPPLWRRFAFSSIIQFLSFIFIEFCRPLE